MTEVVPRAIDDLITFLSNGYRIGVQLPTRETETGTHVDEASPAAFEAIDVDLERDYRPSLRET